MRRTIASAVVTGAALLLGASAAQGQYEQTKATLVLADRVEVPGAILEPGNYLVRIADQQSTRNVIVFQSPDGTRTYATTIATPHRGEQVAHESEFTFYRMPEGQPRVLRSWFPANDVNGQDFYYSAERAAEIRRLTSQEVPVQTAELSPPPAPAPVAVSAPPPPPPPAPIPSEATEATAPPVRAAASDTLPQTASPYPLIALLGATSLGAALVLNRRKRTA